MISHFYQERVKVLIEKLVLFSCTYITLNNERLNLRLPCSLSNFLQKRAIDYPSYSLKANTSNLMVLIYKVEF